MLWTEKRRARRIARAVLEASYRVMERHADVEGLELYSKVLYLVFGYDENQIGEILELSAASSLEWADEMDEELVLRDVTFHVLVTEHIDVRRHPGLIADVAKIVQSTIPANI